MRGQFIIPISESAVGVSIHNLTNGPDGAGTYEVTVSMRKLSSEEILDRLRQLGAQPYRIAAPVAPAEDLSEPEGTRVLGCVEMGPHQEHQIWVENPEWHDAVNWGWSPKDSEMKPHYMWQTCPGMA